MKTFAQFEKEAYTKYFRDGVSQREDVLQECWASSQEREEMLVAWEEYEQGAPCDSNSN